MNLPVEQPLSNCRKNVFAFLSIFIIVFIIYSNNYNASWHFDDEQNILDRESLHLKDLSFQDIKKTFLWNNKLYRPVSCLSLALNYYFDQENVFFYHLINNFIHIFSAIFLFLFIHNTLNLPGLHERYGKDSYNIALLATVLWASNPLHTQAVTYIVQRMAIMAGMFYVMAMYFYIKARTSRQKSYLIMHSVLCVITFFLSLGSKENSIMLPVTLFVYEILFVQEKSFWQWIKNNKKILIIFIIGSSTITLIFLEFVRGGGIFSFLHHYETRTFGLQERLLTESRIIIFYITQLLYPMPSRLSINHNFLISSSLFSPPSTFFAIFFILCLIIFSFMISKKWPLISFPILFFFLNHMVESTFLPLELIFEHRNYIPSMILFIPVSILFLKMINIFLHKKIMQSVTISLVISILIAYGHSTYIRNFTWQTDESLWIDCIDKYPDLWRPYHNLAWYYDKKNMLKNAIPLYVTAITKRAFNYKEKVFTYNNLAAAYQKLKRMEDAIYYYQESEKYYPFFAPTIMNKGVLLLEQGLIDEAYAELTKAIEYDKNHAPSYSNLGFLQLITGDTDSAIYNLEQSIEKGNISPFVYRHLGHAYRAKNLKGKALIMFRKSRELDPDDPVTLLNLAELYSSSCMEAKAEESVIQFFDIFQGSPQKIKAFFEKFLEGGKITKALLPPREFLFGILSDRSLYRSQIYKEIAEYLINKKSEPAREPVHSD